MIRRQLGVTTGRWCQQISRVNAGQRVGKRCKHVDADVGSNHFNLADVFLADAACYGQLALGHSDCQSCHA